MVNERELRRMAKERVDFKSHLGAYIIINVMLFFINIILTRGALWFYWVTVFWGVGLAFHYVNTYHTNKVISEEKEYQKLKQKMKDK
ncbi:2TM domain-containing protein [Candidatus Aenigmatarchaeota archaeon]